VTREGGDPPVLITGAAVPYDEEHAARKRRYLTTMTLRLFCVVLAGVFHHTWWLALAFVAVSIPLPWIAVLVANDRPPRKDEQVNRYEQTPTAIEDQHHPVIEGDGPAR
jgi:hypothetical protein